jgi:hypothetical protein
MANNKTKKRRSNVSYIEHVTYWGKCPKTTKGGAACRNHVLFANGRCASHGGTTPKNRRSWTKEARDKFDAMKARLIARAERYTRKLEKKKKKWLALDKMRKAGGSSRVSTAGLPAKPSPEAAVNRVDRAALGNVGTDGYFADGMGALALAQPPSSESSSLTPISPARAAPPARSEPGETSSPSPISATQPSVEESPKQTENDDPRTAQHYAVDKPQVLPPWHPLVVPGQSWTRYYRTQMLEDHRERLGPFAVISPLAKYIEPKTFED